MLPKKWKNAQILLKSQESAQESWKCKIVLRIRKSAEKVPSTIEKCLLFGTNIQNTCGRIKIPKYRASTLSQGSSHDVYYKFVIAKISRSCKDSWVRIKENKPQGKIWTTINKKTKTNRKKNVQRKQKWPHRDSNPHLDHLLREQPAPRPLGHADADMISNRSRKINSLKPFSLLNATCGQNRELYH